MLLLVISFIAGILTVLAPCVLPLLPVIVGGSLAAGERRRTYTICAALGASVIAFTLLLKASTAFIAIPQAFWNWFSGGILIVFGLSMLFPRLWDSLPFVNILNRSSNRLLAVGYQRNSLWGDVLMGAALGPVFASCSPTYFVVLATVLPVSFFAGFVDLLAYAVGLSGFLLIIALAGQKLVDSLGVTIQSGGWFRRGIGVLFIVVGLTIVTGLEKKAELWLLERGFFDITGIEQMLLGREMNPDTLIRATSTPLTFEQKKRLYPEAPELVSPDGYINTLLSSSGQARPITIGEFKGKKIVLVDIWTYSCINCQRTLPYIKMWYEKYKDQGLEIIGVHTPEFAFEHDIKNVSNAVKEFGLTYPVVLDNEYRTWNAFGNRFWPRKYLIDIDGFIVYDHAGEGRYEETEAAIERALTELAERQGTSLQIPAESRLEEVIPVDFSRVQSPEVYFGSDRNQRLGNGTVGQAGLQTLQLPGRPLPHTLYLGGTWDIQPEYAKNSQGGAVIQFLYGAKSVYMVAAAETPVIIRVTRDGKPLGQERGEDVDERGEVTIHEDRLYKLVEGEDYRTHSIEITVEGSGVKAYTFTFG